MTLNSAKGKEAPAAAPAQQRRRVRRFTEVLVNGKKKLMGYWAYE